MKRKTFIITAAAATAAVPLGYYFIKSKKKYNSPVLPGVLAEFCDEKTLRDIGREYIEKAPAENNKQKLTDLLLTEESGKRLKETDEPAVSDLLDTKMKADFTQFRTFTLSGWVISQTEARQCALFSLTY